MLGFSKIICKTLHESNGQSVKFNVLLVKADAFFSTTSLACESAGSLPKAAVFSVQLLELLIPFIALATLYSINYKVSSSRFFILSSTL